MNLTDPLKTSVYLRGCLDLISSYRSYSASRKFFASKMLSKATVLSCILSSVASMAPYPVGCAPTCSSYMTGCIPCPPEVYAQPNICQEVCMAPDCIPCGQPDYEYWDTQPTQPVYPSLPRRLFPSYRRHNLPIPRGLPPLTPPRQRPYLPQPRMEHRYTQPVQMPYQPQACDPGYCGSGYHGCQPCLPQQPICQLQCDNGPCSSCPPYHLRR
jgi:hypothetical protein